MPLIQTHVQACMKRFVISAAVGLVAMSQIGSAHAQVRNTYNGAECDADSPNGAGNLWRFGRILATSATGVVCPIPKTVFDSTAGVSVIVAASGGTQCRLYSSDVVIQTRTILSPFRTFPGTGVSRLEFSIPSSFLGAMYLYCNLPAYGQILNYLVTEEPIPRR